MNTTLEVFKGIGRFLDEHFDKLVIGGLVVFAILRNDEMLSKELLAALLVLVKSAAPRFVPPTAPKE